MNSLITDMLVANLQISDLRFTVFIARHIGVIGASVRLLMARNWF